MINRISVYLILTLIIMSALSFFGADLFIDDVLTSQAALYKTPTISQALDHAQNRLKSLAKWDVDHEPEYKREFQDLQDLKLIYGDDAFFNGTLRTSLRKYFLLGFGLCLLGSLFVGLFLSRLIDRDFKRLLKNYGAQLERARYLENIAGWQEIARTLAHEIKRPLTPIATWVANLGAASAKASDAKFAAQVNEAAQAIREEMQTLRQMVENFSNFGRLPEPEVVPTEMRQVLERFISGGVGHWPSVTWLIDAPAAQSLRARADAAVLRQVFGILVDNATEANPGVNIDLTLRLRSTAHQVELGVINSGREIANEHAEKMFSPYYSTKVDRGNLGLGLAIAKAQILKQNGELQFQPHAGGAAFLIRLPKEKTHD